ncbi:glycosyltransferase family 9 protein [Desulfococcaceae bacterium HSG8]|nr:glycosyltransferase family 9 protein [Desulfococcaceae bacterium HSG8]
MKKLLIIHQGALGDVVAIFPAIMRLKKNFSQTDILCQSKIGKLAHHLNIIDKYFPTEGSVWASLYSESPAARVQQILCDYHEIVLFSYSEQLEETIGRITGKKIHRIPPRADVSQPVHVAEHVSSHLVKCGLFPLPEEVPRESRRDERAYDPTKILLHPGSGSKRKCWPLSNFMAVEAILEKEGMIPEFILGPAEYFMEELLRDRYDRVIAVSDLPELAALLESAGGFIGNDSGATHLAAFLGVPTVAVFGPSDPERWRPLGSSTGVLRPDDLDCRPCFETNSQNCDKTECFEKTSPEAVIKAFWIMH